jgi:hypothetical protein
LLFTSSAFSWTTKAFPEQKYSAVRMTKRSVLLPLLFLLILTCLVPKCRGGPDPNSGHFSSSSNKINSNPSNTASNSAIGGDKFKTILSLDLSGQAKCLLIGPADEEDNVESAVQPLFRRRDNKNNNHLSMQLPITTLIKNGMD